MNATILALCTSLAASLPCARGGDGSAPSSPPEVLSRIAVIGASVSAGFGLQQEIDGVEADLGGFLAAALPPETEVLCLASSFVFLEPLTRSDEMLEKAREFEPTLVVAVDFLFWFGYGTFPFEEARLAMFEQGLERLDTFECAVVVGDVPDMRRALEGSGPLGPMLVPHQIPEPDTIDAMNERLLEWAAEREERVTVAPLSEFVARTTQGEPIALRGNEWDADDVEDLLQADLLHPTLRGTAALTLFLLDELAADRPKVADWITWNEDRLAERLREHYREEIDEAKAREARRLELRKERLERQGAGGDGR